MKKEFLKIITKMQTNYIEFKTSIGEIVKGKSILRLLFEQRLKNEIFSGTNILDLGSGKKASYHSYSNLKGKRIITINLYYDMDPDILANLEYPFPIKTNSFDNIFAFNLLEHIYNFNNLISESYRILKPKGRFYCESPFLYHLHDNKNPMIPDFARYTKSMLEAALKEAGFRNIVVSEHGGGPFIAAASHVQLVLPKYCFFLIFICCALIDRIILKISKGYFKENRYPLGYFIIAEK